MITAGKLVWMPSSPAGACRPIACDDARPPVSALRDVARVPQPLHEDVPRAADALQPPARLGRSRREAEARQRRNHDVEGVLGPAAVLRRIGERTDELDLLEDRARPAVRDDQRQRVRVAGADVDEVDVDAVDVRHELREGVQLRLGLAPVVVRAPVADELLELRQLRALRLIGDRFLVGPAGRREAPAEVGEIRLWHVDAERPDRRCRCFRRRQTVADDTPMTVAASTSSPLRADVDESARTIIAAKTMIPLRKVTRCVSRSSGFMLFSSNT